MMDKKVLYGFDIVMDGENHSAVYRDSEGRFVVLDTLTSNDPDEIKAWVEKMCDTSWKYEQVEHKLERKYDL